MSKKVIKTSAVYMFRSRNKVPVFSKISNVQKGLTYSALVRRLTFINFFATF